MSRSQPESQEELNDLMRDLGRESYWQFMESAMTVRGDKKSREGHTKHGQRIVKDAAPKLALEIDRLRREYSKKRSGPFSSGIRAFTELPTPAIAFIAAREIINCITKPATYHFVAMEVGRALEVERRCMFFAKKDPKRFRRIQKSQGPNLTWTQKNLFILKMIKNDYPDWKHSDNSLLLAMGSLLVNIFEQTTGFIEVKTTRRRKRSRKDVYPTDALIEWIEKYHGWAEVLSPVFLPTMEPPQSWSMEDAFGGYDSDVAKIRLVKNRNKWYQDEGLGMYEFPEVIESVNALQKTPWRINKDIFKVLSKVYKDQLDAPDYPSLDGYDFLPYPEGLKERNREYQELKTEVLQERKYKEHGYTLWPSARELEADPHLKSLHEDARKFSQLKFENMMRWKGETAAKSKRVMLKKMIEMAERFSLLDRFYFPHSCDFRGRIYPLPNFVNPQGSDMGKALIEFGDSKPILHESDADWLRVAGANRFGYDKAPFEGRIAWVKQNHDKIKSVAQDPFGDRWWHEADDPWCFLAFCFEYSEYLKAGYGFQSHMPVNLDASNNGLQVLSLLSRDEDAAFHTNVVETEIPSDIYRLVAEKTLEKLRAETEKRDLADYWLDFGIDRKTTKRSVMILPYSGTLYSSGEYIAEWYKEKMKERGEVFHRHEMGPRVTYLNGLVWESIQETVHRPKGVMAWLRLCAKEFCEENQPMMWVTPLGFPVLMEYRKTNAKRIQLRARGERIQLQLREETQDIKPDSMKNGISPNVVHSLDAAALQRTVVLAKEFGVSSFAMIHDSYGTHAADVDNLMAASRRAWHSIFEADLLEQLEAQFNHQLKPFGRKVPPPLPKGELNVHDLLGSTYFMS